MAVITWKYPAPLEDAVLLRRYKRFLADVERPDGSVLTVHTANPGSMKTCSEPGRPVRIRDARNPKRKLSHSLEQIHMPRTWIAINTGVINDVVGSLLAADAIEPLRGYPSTRREVSDGAGNRYDFLLEGGRAPCWIEVKNATLREGREARFPDSVTARGRKHLLGLRARVEAGDRAVLLCYVARADVTGFRPAWDIDPAFSETLRDAAAAGVEVVAVRSQVTKLGLGMRDLLRVDLEPV